MVDLSTDWIVCSLNVGASESDEGLVFFQILYLINIYINNSGKIWLIKTEVPASLDSLRSLQLASMSDLILISWMAFFSTLSCQREERKCAVFQVIGKLRSSWQS